jgi:hypothetical protein
MVTLSMMQVLSSLLPLAIVALMVSLGIVFENNAHCESIDAVIALGIVSGAVVFGIATCMNFR